MEIFYALILALLAIGIILAIVFRRDISTCTAYGVSTALLECVREIEIGSGKVNFISCSI